jgi:polyhydroxyalkanoate synthesis regulator phasin
MSLDTYCDKCRDSINSYDEIYCSDCYVEQENKVKELEEKISDLEVEINELKNKEN